VINSGVTDKRKENIMSNYDEEKEDYLYIDNANIDAVCPICGEMWGSMKEVCFTADNKPLHSYYCANCGQDIELIY